MGPWEGGPGGPAPLRQIIEIKGENTTSRIGRKARRKAAKRSGGRSSMVNCLRGVGLGRGAGHTSEGGRGSASTENQACLPKPGSSQPRGQNPDWPEVVTYVLGTICHLCVRAGHSWTMAETESDEDRPFLSDAVHFLLMRLAFL